MANSRPTEYFKTYEHIGGPIMDRLRTNNWKVVFLLLDLR